MNIFGIGITELLLILLIALVVAGPKRMIRWAYVAGVYSAKLRTMWLQAVDVLQKEVDDAGLDVKLPREMPTRQNIGKVVNDLARPYTKEMEEAAKEISNPIKAAAQEAQSAARLAQQETRALKQEADAQLRSDERMGTWGKSEPATTPPANDGEFGAWGSPQHPGQQQQK